MTTGWLVSDGGCGDIYDQIPSNKTSLLLQFGGLKSTTNKVGLCGDNNVTPWERCNMEVDLCPGGCYGETFSGSAFSTNFLTTPPAFDDGTFIYVYQQLKIQKLFQYMRPRGYVELRFSCPWTNGFDDPPEKVESFLGIAGSYYNDDLTSSGGLAFPTVSSWVTNYQVPLFFTIWGYWLATRIRITPDGTITSTGIEDLSTPLLPCASQ